MKKEHYKWKKKFADENGNIQGSRGTLLKQIEHHTGYLVISCWENGRGKQVRAHRFVWECFYGEIPDGLVVNHKDLNKHNNSIENLELVTPQQNVIHAYENKTDRIILNGESCPASKLSEKDVLAIIKLRKEGLKLQEIGDMFGISFQHVSALATGKRWRHLH